MCGQCNSAVCDVARCTLMHVLMCGQCNSAVCDVNLLASVASSSAVVMAMRRHTEQAYRKATHSCVTTGTDRVLIGWQLTDRRMTKMTIEQLCVLIIVVDILIIADYFVILLPDGNSLVHFSHVVVSATMH